MEVALNCSQNGEFGSENGSDRFLPQNRIGIGDFGSESSISDSTKEKGFDGSP